MHNKANGQAVHLNLCSLGKLVQAIKEQNVIWTYV